MRWPILFGLLSCFTLVGAKQSNNAVDQHGSNPEPLSCGNYCDSKPEPPLACGDYLKQIGHSRPDVQYIGCKPVMSGQVPSFEATYRVKGADIAKIDRWLATWAEWQHLRFSCCQWDAPPGFFQHKSGAGFEIGMVADAWVNGHMVDRRSELAKIPEAYLTLTHLRYSP